MPGRPFPARCLRRVLCLAAALAALAPPAPAEESAAEWLGAILGQVVDGKSGAPVGYATITLIWPEPADGSEPKRLREVSDPNGAFEFSEIPAGTYTLSFSKQGYQTSTLVKFTLSPDQLDRADFRLPPVAEEAREEAREEAFGAGVPPPPQDADVEEFLVLGARVVAIEAARAESDELINTLSAEDFSKFAASDVADALKLVAGVNVVEGQFAIIRGLEDRYSSTLYNNAPIPSPDPDKQSVQLDLFASEIVSNLVVAKTFGSDLPSNSSAGSINILTHDYPDEIEFSVKGKSGFNENAIDEFLSFQSGSPVGEKQSGIDTLKGETGASFGGRTQFANREIRWKAVGNWDLDYDTAKGWVEEREPRRPEFLNEGIPSLETVTRSGGLASGRLDLTNGRFDETISERTEQVTGYGGLGIDLDPSGNHRLDGSIFYTRNHQTAVEAEQNGYLPGFDFGPIIDMQTSEGRIDPQMFTADGRACATVCATLDSWFADVREGSRDGSSARRGPLWFTNFASSRSFDIDRDLTVYQLNGEHHLEALPGLRFTWAANQATTSQSETVLGARIFFEPDNENSPGFVFPTGFPVGIDAIRDADAAAVGATGATGAFATNSGILYNTNDIHEDARFGRFDLEYELPLMGPMLLKLGAGGWFEHATRDVESDFLENPNIGGGSSDFVITGATPEELGETMFDIVTGALREGTNDSKRDIQAGNFAAKATFWDRLDVLGGLRIEDIDIVSDNDPFTGANQLGAPGTFPDAYILFDRLDNPFFGEVARVDPDATFNDQLLGIQVPVGPCRDALGNIPDPTLQCVDLRNPLDPTDRSPLEPLLNGRINERKFLPAAGLAWRPLDGLALRGAFSQTVARPSFREMGFYASVELGTDDLVVGNPQLTLSDVTSYDARAEYTWGELGDLAAISGFYKTIEKPIESIVVRNPINAESGALWRTFFNNPNTAQLWGIELETRKNLGFVGPELLEYVSLGSNFTYIHAEVDRTEAELSRSALFFRTTPDETASITGLETSRRLFGQPEWIVNGDLSFDQPDWGSRVTLAVFAISDLLDAAGTATVGPDGRVTSLTLDRYIDSYYTLDLIVSQSFPIDIPFGWFRRNETLPSTLTFKFDAKNLTDSTRALVYDRLQTQGTVGERSFKVGRDYSFQLGFSFAF